MILSLDKRQVDNIWICVEKKGQKKRELILNSYVALTVKLLFETLASVLSV